MGLPTFPVETYESWLEFGRQLVRALDKSLWIVGDWWVAGEQAGYGKRAKDSNDLPFGYETCKQAGYVARAFEPSCRLDSLPFSFHSEVAALPIKNALRLLRKCEHEGWTRRELRQEAKKKRDDNILELPPIQGTYRTIVIDPPWPMEKILREVAPNQVQFDYPVMSVEEIAQFELPLAQQAHVYCWTTQKFLPHAFYVFESWGVDYVFTMVWHKPGGFQPFGLPQYNCEFVLFGRKGSLPFQDTKAFNTAFSAPRREHSRKPDEFYDLVRRVSPGPRIDIFSREARDGFDQHGNETRKFGDVI